MPVAFWATVSSNAGLCSPVAMSPIVSIRAPLLTRDRCYTFGVEGVLLCLELETGKQIWKRDTAAEFAVPTDAGIDAQPVEFEAPPAEEPLPASELSALPVEHAIEEAAAPVEEAASSERAPQPRICPS